MTINWRGKECEAEERWPGDYWLTTAEGWTLEVWVFGTDRLWSAKLFLCKASLEGADFQDTAQDAVDALASALEALT